MVYETKYCRQYRSSYHNHNIWSRSLDWHNFFKIQEGKCRHIGCCCDIISDVSILPQGLKSHTKCGEIWFNSQKERQLKAFRNLRWLGLSWVVIAFHIFRHRCVLNTVVTCHQHLAMIGWIQKKLQQFSKSKMSTAAIFSFGHFAFSTS